jgi:hypothetical protein
MSKKINMAFYIGVGLRMGYVSACFAPRADSSMGLWLSYAEGTAD